MDKSNNHSYARRRAPPPVPLGAAAVVGAVVAVVFGVTDAVRVSCGGLVDPGRLPAAVAAAAGADAPRPFLLGCTMGGELLVAMRAAERAAGGVAVLLVVAALVNDRLSGDNGVTTTIGMRG